MTTVERVTAEAVGYGRGVEAAAQAVERHMCGSGEQRQAMAATIRKLVEAVHIPDPREHKAMALGLKYEASLSLPIDAGERLVQEARALYAKYAHLAPDGRGEP